MVDTVIDNATPSKQALVSVLIANGASLSGAVDLTGNTLMAIQMPAAWTAANLTFQASLDGGTTYSNLFDDSGNEVTVVAAASEVLRLDPVLWAGLSKIKIRSGTSGTPVNQGADRSLILGARNLP